MEALETVDRETSGQFGLRKLAVEKFTFKLPQAQLDVGTVSATIDDEACAFMILSYACQFLFRESTRPPRTPVASRRRHPLTPAMWNAFLKPRLSPTEPYRIDSLCITQPLGHEGGSATGAVDYVYRAGRKVIGG